MSAQQTASPFTYPIDVPGSSATLLSGINNLGQVVIFVPGAAVDGSRAFLRQPDGTFVPLGLFRPTGINDAGQIVGLGLVGSPCLLRQANGNVEGPFNFPFSEANTTHCWGINNVGQIVGDYRDTTALNRIRGFLRQPDGSFLSFDVPGNAVFRSLVQDPL